MRHRAITLGQYNCNHLFSYINTVIIFSDKSKRSVIPLPSNLYYALCTFVRFSGK